MSVYRGFVETGRSFRVEVYELANRQTCLLLCVFAAATILSHYDAIKKIHALYFGPTADRLDLSNRAVGDLREGKLISETGRHRLRLHVVNFGFNKDAKLLSILHPAAEAD